jgi:FkbM family methyltransferase
VCKVVFWGGAPAFEPELLPVFRQFAQQSRTFVDVGANIGYYSLLASSYNSSIRSFAFEPSPTPFRYLLRNAEANDFPAITGVPVALGDRSGTLTFYESWNPKYPDMDQLGSTGSTDAAQARFHGRSVAITAAVDTLDHYLEQHAIKGVDLLKVDVEGAELDVFRGASATLDQDRPMVLFESLGGSPARTETFALFQKHHYRLFAAGKDGLHPLDPGFPPNLTNFVGVPQESVADVSHLLAGTT